MSLSDKYHLGFTGRIVEAFLTSKLPIIFIIASILAGVAALILTPREEEPQIVVPVIDIMINFPGASPAEIENLVTINLERKLWEIDGVEYVYSRSMPGSAVVTVRFYVGENRENSILKTHSKIMSYVDQVPPGVTGWVVRPIEIDDVPIVTFALYSKVYSDYELRRVADELVHRLQNIPDTGRAYVLGGRKRQVKVLLDPEKMATRQVSVLEMERALKAANVNLRAGSMDVLNREILVDAGPFLKSADDVMDVVLTVNEGKAVYLRDVATVVDGPQEVQGYTRLAFGPGAERDRETAGTAAGRQAGPYNQVTIAVSKRKGTNAVQISEGLIRKIQELKATVIPSDMQVLITRDYGKTADEKVDELVKHLGIAVISIIALLTVMLGWRESMIVALAVPMTLAVTLLANLLVGYSINRVTLFALILSLGLLVDDPIVDVENIHRHFKLKTHPPLDATLLAVDEVRPPTILATLAVIASFIPLFFITGMMGPYMRPMALNVPIAMIMSLVIAFTVTPWTTYHALKHEYDKPDKPYDFKTGWIYRTYSRMLVPLLENRKKSLLFLGGVVAALVFSMLLVVVKLVPVKMLPFDNKNEFLILIDMPEGTTLEDTDKVARDVERYLTTVNEVRDVASYVGTGSPIDFNGMVRQYYFRQGSNVADVRVNLLDKHERQEQSHAIVLRIRPDIEKIAQQNGANIKIVEVPPGPPVFSTIVAEVYGPPTASYQDLIKEAARVRKLMESTPQVVDVDDSVEADQVQYNFVVDRVKAGLHGITVEDVARSAKVFLGGDSPTILHTDTERTPLEVNLRLPRSLRSRPEDMGPIRVKAPDGSMVPFHELGELKSTIADKTIYRKNMERVVFVTGETAGRSPVDAILQLTSASEEKPLSSGFRLNWAGEGEWKITLEVFRDLGLAFLGALILIYILLVQQTESFTVPLVIMVAIPLTMIGIMPGFALLNMLMAHDIGQYRDAIFFTATGMIGMIALAGIVVRNSIILIDFIHMRVAAGEDLKQAIVESGSVRFTPILLTAGAAIFGSWIITLDPVFSGLAWSFIFGVFASTIFTLIVVPMIYYMIYRNRQQNAS
ncbi:efflux RND transporter permease subunit [Desulfomonile tiedjei]|uniref:Cation/multidrug efflux pump n=1 Tax=Desulfomonile tiedjei (strain ATCC 49306 / DSM 6799 / DCB-1) TaxID=706587 RepID=I4C318_DESTA|nr:efflux RND transporter permease subunit [Desulfomonile tiedjei]AFM23959.1 cation/multidrug efflux pump [Desulfomonile tiedjei DSM 6799]